MKHRNEPEKNEPHISELWDNFKKPNKCVIGVPENVGGRWEENKYYLKVQWLKFLFKFDKTTTNPRIPATQKVTSGLLLGSGRNGMFLWDIKSEASITHQLVPSD